MRKTRNILNSIVLSVIAALMFSSCQDEDQEFGPITEPTNLELTFEIEGQDANNPFGDGSGIVRFSGTADNALAYRYEFGDGSDEELSQDGSIEHRFTLQGVQSYSVTFIASGTGGVTSSKTIIIEVFNAFDDIEARSFLTGAPLIIDSNGNASIDIDAPISKKWYFDTKQDGHYGVGPTLAFDIEINGGPSQFYFPAFFPAPANSTCETDTQACLCDDELIFTLDSDNNLTFELDNKGATLFNEGHQAIVGGDGSAASCFDFDTSGVKNVSLAPSDVDWSLVPDDNFEARETKMSISDDGFMGYFVTSSTYEIIEITETTLEVRCLDGLNPVLAWYFKFTSIPPN